jgi:hypothetical protein
VPPAWRRLLSSLESFPRAAQKLVQRLERRGTALGLSPACLIKQRLDLVMALRQHMVEFGIRHVLIEDLGDRQPVRGFYAHDHAIAQVNPYVIRSIGGVRPAMRDGA